MGHHFECVNVNTTKENFVGIKYNHGEIKIIFPLGYRIPKEKHECRESIKQLLKTIQLVHEKKLDYEDSGEFNIDADGLPVDSYLWVIKDYARNGIYVDQEKVFKQDNKGKINWKRTFKTKFLIQKKSLVYLNPIVEKNSNRMNIISEIHSYCIDKSMDMMSFLYDRISPLSNVKNPNMAYYLKVINEELLRSYDDRKKLLLFHMKRIVEESIDDIGKKDIKNFGIKRFEYAWEHMIDEVYGTEDVHNYYPDSTYYTLNFNSFNASKLRPDTIMKVDQDLFILDSKYYKVGVVAKNENDLKKFLPSTDSIQKQITYAEFIQNNFKESSQNIYNAFIIPYNMEENELKLTTPIAYLGYAVANWKENLEIEEKKHLKIAVVFVDTKYLMNLFFSKSTDRNKLIEAIKKIDDFNL